MAETLRCPKCDVTATLDGSKITYDTRPCPVAGHPMLCEHMVKVATAALKDAERMKRPIAEMPKYELRFMKRLAAAGPLIEDQSLRHVLEAGNDDMASDMAARVVKSTVQSTFDLAVLHSPGGRQVKTFDPQ